MESDEYMIICPAEPYSVSLPDIIMQACVEAGE
jgi:hypothetical protein